MMNLVTRTAITLAALALPLAVLAPADATIRPPHACSSHNAHIVATKCADRNRDGVIEYLPDGTTR
jgi:hypothetical protein